MRFKVLYILFLVLSILYANYRLPGGVTPRNIISVVMFVCCIIEDRRLYMDKYFGIYCVFLLFFCISSIVTGYFNLFLHRLIGYFFVAYVGYWATCILVTKYHSLHIIINTLIAIGLFDAIITIGQFYGINLITQFPSLIGISPDLDYLDGLDEGDEALGLTLPGVMPTVVYNGYYIMTVALLSLCFLKQKVNIVGLLTWGLFVVTSFMIQQRGPFYILIILSLLMMIKLASLSKSKLRHLLIFSMFLILPFALEALYSFLISGESRYSIGMAATNRDVIIRNTLSFIDEHFFLGGLFVSKLAPHNLFLNAWLMGGVFGFLSILVLTVIQCITCIKCILTCRDLDKVPCVMMGVAFLGFTMNSMLHNAGITSGSVLLWVVWGAFICNYKQPIVIENH